MFNETCCLFLAVDVFFFQVEFLRFLCLKQNFLSWTFGLEVWMRICVLEVEAGFDGLVCNR